MADGKFICISQEGQAPLNLSARQRRFLEAAADPDGLCPYDMPDGVPVLRNEEVYPLTAANLVVFSKTDDTWNTTRKGDALLAQKGQLDG